MMSMNPIQMCTFPTKMVPIVRALAWLVAALTIYIVVAIFGDPFPYPVREIAFGVVVALVLAGDAWRWRSWFRSNELQPPLARQAMPTLLSFLWIYIVFRETYFNPLPDIAGSILTLSFFPLMLGVIIWSIAKNQDEVQRASAFEGFAWGALIGLALIYAAIVILRFVPSVSAWIQSTAAEMAGPLSPAGIGFVFGATFALLVIWICLLASRCVWWARRR